MKPNWKNQTIWTGDNLDIMRGMNSESVDLIYLDPPFNSKANYAAPIGSQAAGAAFKDTWGLNDVNLAWHGEIKHEQPGLYSLLQATRKINGDSMMSYLIYMAIRVMEMKRLLKPTGSIYLHCDPNASHYLKLLMDSVFGKKNFRNEIVWCYNVGGKSKRWFARKHDIILFYTRSKEHTFNGDAVGIDRDTGTKTFGGKIGVDADGRRYQDKIVKKTGKVYRYFLDAPKIPEDWWIGINSLQSGARERTGQPTQKPLSLLNRIVKASSSSGNIVLDPFCGCATSCIAAELEERHWVGIDISEKAVDMVRDRMLREVGLFYQGAHRTDIPKRTDMGKLLKYNDISNKKYLYGEQGGFCLGCQEHFFIQNLTIDHIIPIAKGGTDHVSNLELLCGSCNSIKGTRSREELIISLIDKGYIKRHKVA